MYQIDTKSDIPLYIQLYEEIKKDILTNLKKGTKLPSIREITADYKISKTTVENTYAQLYAEGYIESKPQSGYFVSDMIYKDFTLKKKNSTPYKKPEISYKYDFFPARLSKDSFPVKLWKRLTSKAIDEIIDFGAYPQGQGERGLREEIAKYLISSRGANCTKNQIIITSGFGESMNLLAKIVHHKYDSFAIEEPGYHIARKVFESYGYNINRIKLSSNGLNIKELENSDANIVYITPSNQYPKSITMPISNRLKLLEWANSVGGLILEDDYDSELAYHTRPIPCLQGLDRYDRVVYFGTFSKSLSPALRVSYIVLPNHLLSDYENHFDIHFSKVSSLTQKTLELFIKGGYYEKHIRKIRSLNKKKHDLLKTLLIQHLGETMKIEAQGAGLAILINPAVPFDQEKFKELAAKESMKLYFSKDVSGGNWDALRLGFGGFKEEDLNEAVEVLSEIWHNSIIK